jgi:hypothetical protein
MLTREQNDDIRKVSARMESAHTVECGVCNQKGEVLNAESEWGAAVLLYARGWRVDDILRCPECVEGLKVKRMRITPHPA